MLDWIKEKIDKREKKLLNILSIQRVPFFFVTIWYRLLNMRTKKKKSSNLIIQLHRQITTFSFGFFNLITIIDSTIVNGETAVVAAFFAAKL